MGSYAYLYVNDVEIFNWRNDLDHSIINLFGKEDIVEAIGSEAVEIVKSRGLRTYEVYEDNVDDFSIVLFARNAKELKDRLNVFGYSEKTFRQFLQEIANYELEESSTKISVTADKEFNRFQTESRRQRRNQILGLMDAYNSDRKLSKKNLSMLLEILEYDSCYALYFKLKDVEDMANVTLDVSELAYAGWWDDSMFELDQVADNIQRSNTLPIILTEGIFDRKVLKDSIELLYPHLSKYIKFLDTDYKTEGGASALVKVLKNFAAAGISNRILAIFDNDTAAHEALSTLELSTLPKNYKIVHYPSIELGNNYPTLGPQGSFEMNVNGLAGAIELYLGEDVLKDSNDKYREVQWTGYSSKIRKYQGEVLNKFEVQKAFQNKLKKAQNNKSLIDRQDWHGIKLIIDSIIKNLAEI